MNKELKEIVEQLESCGYVCVAGPLENNTAFVRLKELAEQSGNEVVEISAEGMSNNDLEGLKSMSAVILK
ncbi:hypothetical protein [Lysinibacillus sp. 54212]|uniref:hypothetical protein n=1 Tax=Lysinibacillus sp. 54212 TaxID=3119829 RepID=UPI002FC8380F